MKLSSNQKTQFIKDNESLMKPSWRSNKKADNPLLNQVSSTHVDYHSAEPQINPTNIIRMPKRPRTDVKNEPGSSSLLHNNTIEEKSAFAFIHDPMIEQTHPTDLSKSNMGGNTLSPPLNLSINDKSYKYTEIVTIPLDYRIGQSDLISGQLNRLR